MKTLTMIFPDDNGVELEIEYEVDKELYPHSKGVCIENILMTGSKKPYWFSEFLNDSAFDLIEKRIIEMIHA